MGAPHLQVPLQLCSSDQQVHRRLGGHLRRAAAAQHVAQDLHQVGHVLLRRDAGQVERAGQQVRLLLWAGGSGGKRSG